MQIQAYLTAAAINLKRLAAVLLATLAAFWLRPDARCSRAQRRHDPTTTHFLVLAKLAST